MLHQLLAATSPIIKAAQALGFGVGMGLGSLGVSLVEYFGGEKLG